MSVKSAAQSTPPANPDRQATAVRGDVTSDETIFSDALALPPEERRAFIDRRCANDSAMAERVLRLLEAYRNKSAFLDQPAAAAALRGAEHGGPAGRPDPVLGDRIGRNRLINRMVNGTRSTQSPDLNRNWYQPPFLEGQCE